MKVVKADKKKLMKAARNELPYDLVVTNVQLLNVVTGEIYPAIVYVYDKHIVHVDHNVKTIDMSQIETKEIIDGQGKYLIPGLIDAHVHIESSMLTPRHFAEVVVQHGTTTVITDPHEVANVFGEAGVRYMHDSAEGLPMRQLIDVSSCVPSVLNLENTGATFMAENIGPLLDLPRVVGLAEVMDFMGVIAAEDRMMDIIAEAEKRGKYIQGHAPFVSGRDLSAYIIGGPTTDHESRTAEEGIEKMRNGMHVDARESSITKNIAAVWSGVKHCRYLDHLCLCTDDRESDDILNNGHMNDVIKTAIQCGMDPIDAIRSATYNSAREAKLDDLGAILPGYVADMNIVEDLTELKPSYVIFEGKVVAKDGQLLEAIQPQSYPIETINSVAVKPLTIDDFTLKAPIKEGVVSCNVMVYADYLLSKTELEIIDIPVKDGYFDLSFDPELMFVAVVNRFEGNDNIALHIVKKFGTSHGALATTVSHDSHNLTIVYDTPENALIAANALIECGGGMCAVADGKILHTLQLPVAGLISLKPAVALAEDAAQMKLANKQLGLTQMPNPLLRIVTLALIVIPEVKMSDLGLVDVLKKTLIPLY